MKGITVTLYTAVSTGTNDIGEEIFQETAVDVDNVLVYPSSPSEVLDSMNLYGRKAVYTLGIPKGDTHDWENRRVSFFDEDWRVFGIPTKGIDDLIPLAWNTKVMVERYE